MNEILKTKQV